MCAVESVRELTGKNLENKTVVTAGIQGSLGDGKLNPIVGVL